MAKNTVPTNSILVILNPPVPLIKEIVGKLFKMHETKPDSLTFQGLLIGDIVYRWIILVICIIILNDYEAGNEAER